MERKSKLCLQFYERWETKEVYAAFTFIARDSNRPDMAEVLLEGT